MNKNSVYLREQIKYVEKPTDSVAKVRIKSEIKDSSNPGSIFRSVISSSKKKQNGSLSIYSPLSPLNPPFSSSKSRSQAYLLNNIQTQRESQNKKLENSLGLPQAIDFQKSQHPCFEIIKKKEEPGPKKWHKLSVMTEWFVEKRIVKTVYPEKTISFDIPLKKYQKNYEIFKQFSHL